MSHPCGRCSAQIGSRQGEWRRPTDQTTFEDERGLIAGLGRERRNRSVVTPYRTGSRTQDETPDAGEKLQLAVGVDPQCSDLLVLGTGSGEFQQVRAGETLARIETHQSNEAGYGVVELKKGAVPAEGCRSDDQHWRGVDPIDHKRPPLCRETPHPPDPSGLDNALRSRLLNALVITEMVEGPVLASPVTTIDPCESRSSATVFTS